jgi:hypothetical protein
MDIAITPENVMQRFTSLLKSFDFEEEFRLLEIGKLHIVKKRNALRELKALYIALWKIALDKSLPEHADNIFRDFIDSLARNFKLNENAAAFLKRRIAVYDTLLNPTKEQNFTEVATKLLTTISKRKDPRQSLVLKLSLHIRKVYTLIFKELI